jgi:hypothetical protein
MRKYLLKILSFSLATWFITDGAFSQALTGSGTSTSPYLIYTYAQVDSVRNHLTSHFRLMADIDASSSETDNSGAGFAPIGSTSKYFRGYLHGGGHVINNLHINRTSSSGIGLFGAILTTAVIDSIGLTNVSILGYSKACALVAENCYATVKDCYATGSVQSASSDLIGGLVAYNNSGTITGCSFSGSVSGLKYVGGLTGENDGVIKNSSAKGKVSGSSYVGGLTGLTYGTTTNCCFSGTVTGSYQYIGGLIGESLYSTINNSYAMGSVKGAKYVGGLIGWSSGDKINYCFTTNDVTAKQSSIGGFIGYTYNKDTISYSYSTGNVTGNTDVGGFIGANISIVKNCYSTGNVTGSSYVGGMNGFNSGKLYDSYSTGLVSGPKLETGGLTGYNITASGCYWNTSTSGQSKGYAVIATSNVYNVVGLTTTEIKNSSNLDSLNFTTIWKIREDSTYAGLQNISDNAPFAFSDVINVSKSVFATGIPTSSLLANDYDIETLQKSLTLKVESISGGTFDTLTNKFYFPDTANTGNVITVKYRIGEVRSVKSDTLWGNRAQSVIVLVDLSNISNTTKEDTPIIIDLSSVASIYSGALSYSILKSPVNGKITINNDSLVYTPDKNFYGLDSLSFIVSNDISTDTGKIIITVTSVNDAPEITSTAPLLATENMKYTYTVSAIDVDGDALTYNLIGQPSGMNISESGVITWTPLSGITSSGEVTLTVSDGKLSDTETFTITVTAINETYTITASAGSNGSISPSGEISVDEGNGQSFTIAANTGYYIADVLVDGTSVGAVTSYSFTEVTADHTIAASFAVTTDTITAIAGSNGSISPSGEVGVDEGNGQSFTITANAGYHIADVLVDGTSVGAVTSYSFTEVTANHTITASFAVTTDTITAIAGSNGSISPSGKISVDEGNGQSFTITANAGYHIADVLVDGTSVGTVTSYSFTEVTADHTITASFTENRAPVITSTAPVQVAQGDTYTYTVIATDPDGDPLTYSLSGQPDGMTITGNIITWTPGDNITSSGEVTLTVSDGELNDTQTFTIIVVATEQITLAELKAPGSGCENGSISLAYTILTGIPTEYQIIFNDGAIEAGFSNTNYITLNSSENSGTIEFDIPQGVAEGTYTASLQMRDSFNESSTYIFEFTIDLSTSYLVTKFDDVILVDNSSGRFTAYQWYKNDTVITGANKQFYNDPEGLSGSYFAKVITTDNDSLQTCPLTIANNNSTLVTMEVYPNPVNGSQNITARINGMTNQELQGSTLTIFNSQGELIYKSDQVSVLNSLNISREDGLHEIQLVTASHKKITWKVIVLK